jgi:hypothetical protein
MAGKRKIHGGAFNADFRGQENNQSFRGRKPRFYGDFATSALRSLIVFLARNDLFEILSTFSFPCLRECFSGIFPVFSSSCPRKGTPRPFFDPDFWCTLCGGFGPKNNQHPGARVMDGSRASRFFLEPKPTFQRRYEALRAVFVEGEPLDQVADRFGYKPSALRSMACRFHGDCRRGVTPPFFFRTGADVRPEHAWDKTGRAPNHPKSPTVAR